ncbi:MAG: DciA family protein [Alphaproteobacteria bacterium]
MHQKNSIKTRKFYGMQTIDEKLNHLLKPIFQGSKKEFILINNLVKNWHDIIGAKYAKFCEPKLVNINHKNHEAKLTIAVFNPAIGFYIEQNQALIIERIARLYGFKAVSKIIIKQEPKLLESQKPEKKISDPALQEKITNTISSIENPELKTVLDQLANDIFGKN